jgi:hypothetical protein
MTVYVRLGDRLNSYHSLTVEILNVWEAGWMNSCSEQRNEFSASEVGDLSRVSISDLASSGVP